MTRNQQSYFPAPQSNTERDPKRGDDSMLTIRLPALVRSHEDRGSTRLRDLFVTLACALVLEGAVRRRHKMSGTLWGNRSSFGVAAVSTGLMLLVVGGCGGTDSSQQGIARSDAVDGAAQRQASPGHAQMLALLDQYRAATPQFDPFLGSRGLTAAQARLAKLGLPQGIAHRLRIEAVLSVANEELRLGLIDDAIEHFAEIRQSLPKARHKFTVERWEQVMFQVAVGYLRLAESENCVHCQTGASCVLPIRGDGVHQLKTGSRAATEVLEQLLAVNPDHLSARWLLNIAQMTLGGYPDSIPETYRIDSSRFAADDFPRFSNVALELGVATRSLSGGVVADDFNGDDAIDLMVSNWHSSGQLRLFINDGRGKFTDQTEAYGLNGILGGLNLVQGDFNNDGQVDVLVLRGAWKANLGQQANSLLKNHGGKYFTDVTFDAGLGLVHYPTQTAAWYDVNRDSHLDLFVGNEDYPSQLFMNDGEGGFVDVAERAGVTNDRYAKAVSWGDFNQDGRIDLYVSNYDAANRLYRNDGDGTFTDVAEELSVESPLKSFGTWFWDYNNDGLLDLFVGSYPMSLEDVAAQYFDQPIQGERDHLYQGVGEGRFAEVALSSGVTTVTDPMGANFGDLDLDGYLDFYLGTGYPGYESLMPNVMYHNQRGKGFADVTMAGGFGHLQKGHGVAFADFRGVGETDVFIELGGAYPGDAFTDAYFKNPGFGNHSIRLKLIGIRSNRSAIGAHIQVRFTEAGETRCVHRWVNSGGSFGANPLVAHIGVGKASKIDHIQVTWPATGETTELDNVDPDGSLLVIHEPAESASLPDHDGPVEP